MSNADKHRAAHEAFNRRDYNGTTKDMRDDIVYDDHGRNMTMKSKPELIDWLKGWTQAFSDARPDEPTYVDGGEYSIALFKARGTNDGEMGPLKATGNRLDMAFCEVFHWGDDGMVDKGEAYYDTMTMMVQMGVMEPPPAS